jgi:hypothetical protein
MTDTKQSLTPADLRQFTGTEKWHRHPFVRTVLYTDGVQYVAEKGGAYWLLDDIAFAQRGKRVAAEAFQLWRLRVHPNHTGTLTCEDGNGNVVFTKALTFTDFPLEEITLYFTNGVILLPSEY